MLVGARELLVPTYKLFLHSSAIVYYMPKLVIGNATEIHGAVLGSCDLSKDWPPGTNITKISESSFTKGKGTRT